MSWWLSHISVDIAIWLPELKLGWFFITFCPASVFSLSVCPSLNFFSFWTFSQEPLRIHKKKIVKSKCKCKCVQILISGNRVGAKWEITFLHRNISERRKLKSFFVPKPIYIYIKISWKKYFDIYSTSMFRYVVS